MLRVSGAEPQRTEEADPMPHHKSAAKRIKTNRRDQLRNTATKSELKTLSKRLTQDIANKTLMSETVSKLDQAVRRGVIPKAVANRRKSRLARMANRVRKGS
jgi:ribosomal protein S20